MSIMTSASSPAGRTEFFHPGPVPVPIAENGSNAGWRITVADGPVIATAIHDGHAIRSSLRPFLALDAAQRLREEDPLTGWLGHVGDIRIDVPVSRFQVDHNRPRAEAVYRTPQDCWGLSLWRTPLPEAELQQSLADWDRFRAMVGELIERLLARWQALLVIDLHSYNHRRDGSDGAPAPQAENPDIELGLTTADPQHWRGVCEQFADALRSVPVNGRQPDVRANMRFPTGGDFPEWIHATWGPRLCTISPEYKKTFMDEHTGQADIAALHALRDGLQAAVDAVRPQFLRRRS